MSPLEICLLAFLALLALASGALGIVFLSRMALLERNLADLRGQVALQPLQAMELQSRLSEQMGHTAMGVDSLVPALQALRHDVHELRVREGEAREMLRRLEFVMAGAPQRGLAGENILSEVLAHLPPGMRENNLRLGGKVVEFALKLPGNKFLPVDSKWPDASWLEQLQSEEDPEARKVLAKRIEKAVLTRASEVAKYLQPDRTMMLGVAAVPDAVYHASVRAHARAYRLGVIVIPYSLAVPYVLSVLVLAWRFGQVLDPNRLQGGLAAVGQSLESILGIVETHLVKASVMTENASTRIRREVLDAERALNELGVASVPDEARGT